jgi:thiol-disulfide isomerase/thioredoxin
MIRPSLLAIALAAVPLAGAASSESAAPVGGAEPTLSAKTLDGGTFSPAGLAGKVVVLNFWATWCPPCRAETPDLVAAYKKLHAPDVAFLGVDTTETAPAVKTFISAKGVPYQTVLAGADAYNRFGISYIPTTIVIDEKGIVRARWIGGVTPDQLAQYVASARAGKDADYLTDGQKHIDAMLQPAQFDFSGDAATVGPAIAAAQKRIADVDAYAATLSSGNGAGYDDERTMREQGVLLDQAAKAARRIATTPADQAKADMMLATAYGDQNRFADAVDAYKSALALAPGNPDLTFALSRAYYRLHDYDQMAATARDYIRMKPQDPSGYDELGLAFQRSRRFSDAVQPYETAVSLMIEQAHQQPEAQRGDAYGAIADESLDLGNVYVALGDRAGAQRAFGNAVHYAKLIPQSSAYAELRTLAPERAAEGMAAVALVHGGGAALSLAHWTGPDLPGSVASTYKYRLIVVAPPSKSVTLTATGLGPGWIASFCADRLCSPRTVTFVQPVSGVKTYEFQLVPPKDGAKPGKVGVSGAGASATIP